MEAALEPLAVTFAQARKMGAPCRAVMYEEIKKGRLRAVKRGRSTIILMKDLKDYLANLPAIALAEAATSTAHGQQRGRARPRRRSA